MFDIILDFVGLIRIQLRYDIRYTILLLYVLDRYLYYVLDLNLPNLFKLGCTCINGQNLLSTILKQVVFRKVNLCQTFLLTNKPFPKFMVMTKVIITSVLMTNLYL